MANNYLKSNLLQALEFSRNHVGLDTAFYTHAG